jgi:glucokinase
MSLALGIDLGGTKIAAAVFDEEGELVGKLVVLPALADGPAAGTVENLFAAADGALRSAGIDAASLAGIGAGSPGPLDPWAGILLEVENLPQLHQFPLRRKLEERYGTRAAISNDANCFALCEALHSAGRGEQVVIGVTLGTGCGVGIVIDRRIFEGTTANGGEVYRAPLGGLSFDEALSGPGLERFYRTRSGSPRNGAEIGRLAAGGNAAALGAFEELGSWLAKGLGILAAVLDPGVIVLGGSVAASFRFFEGALRAELPRYVAPAVAERLRIEPSPGGPLAGPRGAAALVSLASSP